MKRFLIVFIILFLFPVLNVYSASSSDVVLPLQGFAISNFSGDSGFSVVRYDTDAANGNYYVNSVAVLDNLSSVTNVTLNFNLLDASYTYVYPLVYASNELIDFSSIGFDYNNRVPINVVQLNTYKGYTVNANSSFTMDLTEYITKALDGSYKYVYLYTRSSYSKMSLYYTLNYSVTRSMPEPTASPTSTPSGEASPVPTTPPTLEDYTFYSYCYDGVWKDGDTLKKTVTQKFVPSSTSDFSSDKVGIYNNLLVFNVRIPFRVECSGFDGEAVFDANYKFDLDYEIMELSENVSSLVDFSTPWIESSDPNFSFNATNSSPYGFGFDVINMSLNNSTSAEFYYCFNAYVSLYSNALFTNHGQYINIKLSNINFNVLSSSVISPVSSSEILQSIDKGIQDGNAQEKQFHDEELQKTNEAIGQLNSGVSQATDVLSKWEIVTMPVTLVGNFADAIASDGSTGLTFPSFSLMGYQIWPAYTFDLSFVKENFPLLYNSLHIVSGILIVIGFVRYLWRKWALLVGDDMPEEKG